jgi:hypothetical protein
MARWSTIASISPDLAPAVALQQRLVRLMLDAAGTLDEPVPETLEPAVVLEKWRRGLPALRNVRVAIPDSLKAAVPGFCEALVDAGAGDSALHLLEALRQGAIDPGSLLAVSLDRNQKAVRTSSLHMGLAPDLVWLLGELAAAPLACHLQERLMESLSAQPGSTVEREWSHGYCACCGSWPVLIESLAGVFALRCSFCALAWTLPATRCVYCGNSGEDFVTAAPDLSRPDRRIQLCSACGCYTKVIGVASATPFPLLAIEDLATMDLDQGAMSRDYRRPPLADLDAIEPIKSRC